MYIWNISKLRDELKVGPLAQVDSMFYLLGLVIIGSLTIVLIEIHEMVDFDHIRNGMIVVAHPVVFALNAIISIFGVVYLWFKNGADNGKLFIERYISVIFVLQIRFFVFSLIVGILFGLVLGLYAGLIGLGAMQFNLSLIFGSAVLSIGMELLLLYRAAIYIESISAKK